MKLSASLFLERALTFHSTFFLYRTQAAVFFSPQFQGSQNVCAHSSAHREKRKLPVAHVRAFAHCATVARVANERRVVHVDVGEFVAYLSTLAVQFASLKFELHKLARACRATDHALCRHQNPACRLTKYALRPSAACV